jgi:riboflavin kinase/FMN adenylyltransferase
MNKIYFNSEYNAPIVLALGFFDCIHNGHKTLIDEVKRQALKLRAQSALFTFANDPNPLLNKKKQIYTILERSVVLENMGVENIVYAYFNHTFASMSGEEFLKNLCSNFNIKAIVVGRDYTFGANASCGVDFLKEFLPSKGIKLKIVPFEKNYLKKISSSNLKKYIQDGDVELLNTCLPQPYFMVGTIIHSKHRGSIIGYPTANLSIHEDCMRLAEGIYASRMYIDNRMYLGMTNVGSKPTFAEYNYTIETYLFNFGLDIYGKEVRLEFLKKIRDVKKFNSVPALVKQLQLDRNEVLEYFKVTSAKSDCFGKG